MSGNVIRDRVGDHLLTQHAALFVIDYLPCRSPSRMASAM
jgi:hypothetical protein